MVIVLGGTLLGQSGTAPRAMESATQLIRKSAASAAAAR
ncbi:hypothetical protein NSERUTF1_0134 [Nocardia seriolae]|nr:hypothetical protein NSERUTF1_0134 [Nocardia seriolae]